MTRVARRRVVGEIPTNSVLGSSIWNHRASLSLLVAAAGFYFFPGGSDQYHRVSQTYCPRGSGYIKLTHEKF